MNPQETPSNSGLTVLSIFCTIVSVLPFKEFISLTAGIGAIIAAIFSIRNSYYSTKVSKKTLEHDKEMDSQ